MRAALDEPTADVAAWRFEPVGYDFLNPSSGGVYRFMGSTTAGAPWALILKVTRSAEGLDHGKPVPRELELELREAVRWDRELRAYASGFLGSLDGELRAARCHGWAQHDDATAWLWLEDLGTVFGGEPWDMDRWAEVGHALGQFNASNAHAREEWLGRRWLRTWTTKLTPFHFAKAVTPGPHWDEPRVVDAYPPSLRARLVALWAQREQLLAAIESMPQVCSHLDSHRRNLAAGPHRLAAIDWGLTGLAAPGEEIASTLVGTIASGELAAERTDELAETLFENYLSGLRDGGWRGEDADVRFAFAAACGLRTFSVLGLDADDVQFARSATLSHALLRLGGEALERVA